MSREPLVLTTDRLAPGSEALQHLAGRIREGCLLVLPTDTCYILAADGTDPDAVRRVFDLKGRDHSAPIHVLLPDPGDLERLARVTPLARRLARAFLPGPLTLVLERRPRVPSILVAGLPTVGLRVPDEEITTRIARVAGRPLTATSANRSGEPTPYSLPEVWAGLGDLRHRVAAAIDAGAREPGRISTLVDARFSRPRILRPGVIDLPAIEAVLREPTRPG